MPEASTVNTTIFAGAFAVYTMAIVAVGLYSARYARRSNEDYFLAGRSLGSWVAALSASASSESAVGNAIPEPSLLALIAAGCVGLLLRRTGRRRAFDRAR